IADASGRIGEESINMHNFLQSMAIDKLYWENKRKEVENGLGKSKPVIEPVHVVTDDIVQEKNTIHVSDTARLTAQSAVATISERKGDEAIVFFGTIKSKVKLERLVFENK